MLNTSKNFEKPNLKISLIYATIGALICLVTYLICKDNSYGYRSFSIHYDRIICPIFSIVLDLTGAGYDSSDQPAIYVFNLNVYYMTIFGWIFLFINSLKSFRATILFLFKILVTVVLCGIASYLFVFSLPMTLPSYSSWNLLFNSVLPALSMFAITVPSIINLFADLFIGSIKSKSAIIYDSFFVLIAIILFVYVYWSQF